MTESRFEGALSSAGLGAAILIVWGAARSELQPAEMNPSLAQRVSPPTQVMRMLAVGDINMGRSVGQKMLEGDTLFSFHAVQDTFMQYDLVFGNLESNLSDQNGETEDPENNLVFTGPPSGAAALVRAGVTLVSTANNHALDYGIAAARETAMYLRQAGVAFAGTDADSGRPHAPAIITRNGIRLALFAVTDIMNTENDQWRSAVADADTGVLFPLVRATRDSVDFIVVSLHGGEEYADHPTERVKQLARSAIDAGADLVLGHHPHVPYGIEYYKGRCIVHSLGNFVFYQPSRYWSLRSYAVSLAIVKDSSGTRMRDVRCLPVRCGYQPIFLPPGHEANEIREHVRTFSSIEVAEGYAWHD